MFSGKKESAVTVVQYDDKIKRKSLEDPLRHHRRSSIPFVDRKPAVRFIRSIEQREASIAGPNEPGRDDKSSKPILKSTNYPILVSNSKQDRQGSVQSQSTNDDLENCRNKTDMIMDRISRAERIARGSMDVLTFPTTTQRIEALSRYQGSMTISVCTIDMLTASSEYAEYAKKGSQIATDLQIVVEYAQQMFNQANAFQGTAKKLLSRAKHRYNEWESLLRKNSEFKIDNAKLSYPIYTHKRMPESVTLFEDTIEDPQVQGIDGYVRICRKYPEETITLHFDSSEQTDQCDSLNFQESTPETQMEVIKFVTNHGKDLLLYSDNYLSQSLEMLLDQELDDAFDVIRRKINSIEYDESFDPLCALELKNALGELVARKAELLNTAEQIVQHCKQITAVAKMFYRFTKRSVKGGGGGCACCIGGSSKSKLLHLLGLVSVDDITLVLPLTLAIAQDVFHMDPFNFNNEDINDTNVE